MRSLSLALLSLAGACGAAAHPPGGATRFAAARDRITAELREHEPQKAMSLGLHEYDGRLPDRSAAGLAAAGVRLRAAAAELDGIDPAGLSPTERLERNALRGAVSAARFELESARTPWRNPFAYLRALNILDYLTREYAPLDERARALLRYMKGAHELLAQAKTNLSGAPIPRPFVDVGVMVASGGVEFLTGDAKKVLSEVKDEALRKEVLAALEAHAADLKAFRDYLVTRRADAGNDYALGPEMYLQMLAEIEGVVTDLPTLERVATEDTAKNLAALDEAARQIDPRKTTAQVVGEVMSDLPSIANLLETARAQVAETRTFLATHPIVAIPSPDVAEVQLSPPFMRGNPAFLESAGPFEPRPVPSFYYITAPDPSWPAEQQRTSVPPRPVLYFITIHEVWPGHFLQDLYTKKIASPVVKSYCSYAFTEGWAHYVEEVAWDEGFGGGDPRMHIGQLINALMRDVRFIVSLGLHTKGMSVDEATKLFQEKAYLPGPVARNQALRGTVDPLYLSYTLGKLMIKKMRSDYIAKTGATPQAFHEKLLSTGCQRIPVLREALGLDGPAL